MPSDALRGDDDENENKRVDKLKTDLKKEGRDVMSGSRTEPGSLLRSRYKRREDASEKRKGPLSSSQDIKRLKSACHQSWMRSVAQLMNNNVKGNRVFSGEIKASKDCGETSKSQRNGGGKWSLSVLYKFLRVVLTYLLMFLKAVLLIFILIFVLYCLMVLHKPTQAFISRHTQDLIYPFMRTVRFAALPFIKQFPKSHELYEDACLLSNPFFEMNEVSCWPCESVRHVIDLTGFSNFTSGYYQNGIPFIVKDAFSHAVKISDLQKMYLKEEKLAASVLLQSTQSSVKTLEDLFRRYSTLDKFSNGNLHTTWKINRAQYARMMRKYFSRPYYIPSKTEISVQHFLYIDEPMAEQYEFPVTEFANVFVMQAEGRRLIVLIPMKHCRSQCKAISVVLQPNDVLFYNWLFWRPISFPMKALQSTQLSVTYVGSFY